MKFFKYISLMLAVCFMTSAMATPVSEISEAFGRFNYAMNVDWDQNDPEFKAQAERELAMALEGTDPAALLKYTIGTMKDARAREDFKRLLAGMNPKNASRENVTKLVQEWVQRNRTSGASFLGINNVRICGRTCDVITVVLLVAVIGFLYHNRDDYHEYINTPFGSDPEVTE